jgi:hypothetical protein
VSFFGMKWDLPNTKPIIDHYIGRYRDEMGSSVPDEKNLFDYGLWFDCTDTVLLGINEIQPRGHIYRDYRVNEMCDSEDLSSVSLNFLSMCTYPG